MKILAGVIATCLLAAPAFAQDTSPAPAPQAGADQGKPADTTAPADDSATASADKPADTPEPAQAPPGTTPDKPAAPADAPNG